MILAKRPRSDRVLPESARSAADKILPEQYKVAILDYSYIVPNFSQGYGDLVPTVSYTTPLWDDPGNARAHDYLYLAWKVLAKCFNKSGQRLIKN